MTLPDPRGATSTQQQTLVSYSRALRDHEQGHYDIARRAASDIDQSLLAIPAMTDCKLLDTHANAKGHELLEKYNELSRQYDKDTQHGKTQGAWLDRSL
jgi:predicted secreted Zn-dependent protease